MPAEERFTFEVPGKGEVSGVCAGPRRAVATSWSPTAPAPGWTIRSCVGFTRALQRWGLATLRFNFPYIEAGRRSPDRARRRDRRLARGLRGGRVASAGGAAGLGERQVATAGGWPRWRSPRACRPPAWCSSAIRSTLPASPTRSATSICTRSRCRCSSSRARGSVRRRRRCWSRCSAKLGDRATLVAIEGGGHSFERSRKDDPREVGAVARARSSPRSSGSTGLADAAQEPARPARVLQPPAAPPGHDPTAPPWALAPGYEVRQVVGDKEYRCPGCDHIVRPGSWHLVVVPDGDADAGGTGTPSAGGRSSAGGDPPPRRRLKPSRRSSFEDTVIQSIRGRSGAGEDVALGRTVVRDGPRAPVYVEVTGTSKGSCLEELRKAVGEDATLTIEVVPTLAGVARGSRDHGLGQTARDHVHRSGAVPRAHHVARLRPHLAP